MKDFLFISSQSWRMVDGKSKIHFYLSILLFLTTTLLRVSTPVVFSWLVMMVNQSVSPELIICLCYALIFCILRFLEEFRLAFYVYFEQILQKSLVLTVLNKYFRLFFADIRKTTSSETTIIIDRGLGGIRSALYNAIFTLLPLIFESVFLLAIVWYSTDIVLTMEILLIIIVFVWITYLLSDKTQRLQQKWFVTASENYKLMSEGVRSFESLRSFQSSKWMTSRYEQATDKFIHEVKISLRPGILLGMIQGVLLFLLFFIATYSVIDNTAAGTERTALLILVNGLLLQIALPLLAFSASYQFFIQGLSSARQLFDIMVYPSGEEKISHTVDKLSIGFTLSGVSVSYPGRIINYMDMSIPENEIIIISGVTGSGKSTLAKVLSGLHEYQGTIETKFTPQDVFYLRQQVDIFDINLQDNITLGQEFEREKFDTCIIDAGFTPSEIIGLSQRSLGEMGSNISGGQAQRIGLARMLYHGAKVMVFDEPTTGLDDETIARVLKSIQTASTGRTTIIVTHDKRVKDIGTLFIDLSAAD